MAEQDSDRSEEATPHKLEEARKKGSVAKSNDFNAMAMLAALAVSIYSTGWDTLRQSLHLQQKILARATELNWSADGVAHWMGVLLTEILTMLGPLFLTLVVVAVLVNVLQTGPISSFHPLIPDLERLNPAAGLKRVMSMRTLFEAVKSIIKLAVLALVLYVVVRDAVPGMIALTSAEPRGHVRMLIGLAGSLLFKMVMALLVIGLMDLVYTRWEFGKRMRMSKRDVKDESKNREGDPRVRSRLRELRKEMLKRSRSVARVPSADVVITNPTRIAVALSYKHGTSGAPTVVAKGAGELARKMRLVANKHQIPIVQNKPLARALFREVDYNGYVPEKLYPQVAKIMVWVYSMREHRRASGRES